MFSSDGTLISASAAPHCGVMREAGGSGNASPYPGRSREVGQVHEATLSRVHPHQPWSHILMTFCICHNVENNGVSSYQEPLSSVFSSDGTLISASAAPHWGEGRKRERKNIAHNIFVHDVTSFVTNDYWPEEGGATSENLAGRRIKA